MKLLIKKATIVSPTSPLNGTIKDIFIVNGIIKKIAANITEKASKTIQQKGLCISMGWVDIFAHFCDPGLEYRETIETGLAAAAAGGFTDVCVLPNNSPVTDNKSQVEYIKQKATTGDLSNYSNNTETSKTGRFEVNQELLLKIAIGVGRMMHSAAVSLGRNTMDAPDASHESYTSLATQMEMNLHKISLTVFESTARFQENHPTLHSFSTDSSLPGATAVVAKTTNFASQDLKNSDVYVQNQLDIADTLSCLAFVQDTRLSLFEDAMLCNKRAVDIYSFFLGNRSEAVEKALHNIAICMLLSRKR